MEKVIEYARRCFVEKGSGMVMANFDKSPVSCYYAIEGGYWWKTITDKYPDIVKKRMDGDVLIYDESGILYLFDEYGLMLEKV